MLKELLLSTHTWVGMFISLIIFLIIMSLFYFSSTTSLDERKLLDALFIIGFIFIAISIVVSLILHKKSISKPFDYRRNDN